jgi:Tfp pilus assembly protein PilN
MKAVNLLPPDLRSGPRTAVAAGAPGPAVPAGGPGAFVLLGALALAVVALAGYVLTANTVKQRKADLATATASSASVTRQAQALRPYADFDAVAKARVATVRDLVSERFAWDRALRDLSRAVPAGVTLSQLDGTVRNGVGSGGSGSLRSALDVPAFELQGCTASQTDVARLMSRLRTVDGVTRVSLGKSDKDVATPRPATADPAAATTVTAANACGKGDRPTFDVVAFFEDDAAAATAADPASATATGTASTETTSTGSTATTTSTGSASTSATAPATTTPSPSTTTQGTAK